MTEHVDIVIIGAGAAGMMAAIETGKRGRRVIVIDHARAPGEKIRISGGGRCNFTNIHTAPKNFLSANPHFCKSALARYTPQDFIGLIERHGIAWHQKTLGQLFCTDSARDIVRMLLAEMKDARAALHLGVEIGKVEATATGYAVATTNGTWTCEALIVATGGKSIPKMGATGFAYGIAEQFGLPLIKTRPALVPLTLDPGQLETLSGLSGIAVNAQVRCGKTAFEEAVLFTHRGLSGPAILQISSFWREGDDIRIGLRPGIDLAALLKAARTDNGRRMMQTVLGQHLPGRLAQVLAQSAGLGDRPLANLSDKAIDAFCAGMKDWPVTPAGSEGYRTAEVTLGGVDTRALDSRSMQARDVPGLYFVGECVDVTGWLGGYNFQWAWASGVAAGRSA